MRRISAALAAVATASLLLAAGGARASTGGGPCSVPGGAHRVASVAGVLAWWQIVPTPASVRRQYGAGATYRSYSGCAPGLQPRVLFRDYVGDDVAIRVAGHYVGLLDRGAMESLYLSDLLTGRTTSTRAFTLSLQDNGGSEANEPGPLVTWTVTPGGWLVYLDGLSDFEGFGTALVVVSQSGATTLALAPNGPTPEPAEISRLVVRGNTVHWWSSLTGAHHVKLRRRLLPAGLPSPLPNACQLVPPSLAQEVLGPLAATPPPPPQGAADRLLATRSHRNGAQRLRLRLRSEPRADARRHRAARYARGPDKPAARDRQDPSCRQRAGAPGDRRDAVRLDDRVRSLGA